MKHVTLGAKLGLVLIALVVLWMFVTSGEKTAATGLNPIGAVADLGLDGIKKKVATDAVAQYEIAKRGGSKIEICAHAGMVSAAWLQAQDEASYRTWKATEKADCLAAGMPQQ
ncbi:MAG: hypothetical protein ABI548_03805 [Polyangiaceae bacterium]